MAKSPNENLNYALPIGLLMDAPEGVADIDVRVSYQFDVFDSTLTNVLKERFALPLSLDAFFDTFMQRTGAYFDTQLAALLEQERERLFPNGEGSTRLLHEIRSEEHTSELQSLMRISYAVFCLQKKKHIQEDP